ncbi:unnamed protein product [Vitrella brassicaformis CCMP3155]|uniref:RING-type domain-containing protein n=1 Tax=Vitrella brassicaformis (strain CCMP3155) TaxID=1169540 RepID=A0A0G4EG53_VITBC|nr:unnamed protein product [Vitrella brassicaformis CCMP3155]|eukprot:CEL94687.1 unnamed protein product [Vitrella brassicaformis CCMP3155]
MTAYLRRTSGWAQLAEGDRKDTEGTSAAGRCITMAASAGGGGAGGGVSMPKCSVCYEEYQSHGDKAPDVLRCGHSVCAAVSGH